MLWLRSALYNVVFYVNLALFLVLGACFFLTPRKMGDRGAQSLGHDVAVVAAR